MKSATYSFILAGIVCLCTTASATAQTKEETIAWINKKIQQYGSTTLDYCHAAATWQQDLKTNAFFLTKAYSCNGCAEYRTVIQYAKITKATIQTDKGCEATPTIVVEGTFYQTAKLGTTPLTPANILAEQIYLPWAAETGLLDRMVKAFNHLAELSKPKETF